ncbi:chitinase [Stackebrandtia albiflava]|uniref:chitinase n=1 Tax=Stackebrandtia albiflava TaxID=406432 RepID=A0A562V3Y8_9ACTN|nr:glycoside hydrolase family 18 chitinase [Stackebrandtia albiflava]TWJ12583.1 chitinase [Stackebrandtia albiflava]
MRRLIRALLIIGTVLVTALGLTTTAHAQTGLTAEFRPGPDWGTGYAADYVITNDSAATVSGWTLAFTLPDGHRVSALWNASYTVSGQRVTVTNTSWNGDIAPGGSLTIGFNVAYSGTNSPPVDCRINDGDCTGGQGPGDDTEPPSAPGTPTVTGTTARTVSLQWTAATDNVGVTGYQVHVNGQAATETSGTTATLTGLTPDTSYQVTVRAVDAAGNLSPFSAAATARTGPDSGEPGGEYRKVGYFTQWGIYGRNYLVKDMVITGAAADLTHINYAFGNVNQQGRCFMANQTGVGDAWADYQRRFTAAESVDGVGDVYNQPLAGNFNQLKELKELYPDLKIMMSLGGWTWSKYFSDAALPQNRQAFVASCIDLFIKGNLPCIGGEPQCGTGVAAGVFDGIDLDWEWPGSEGNTGNVIRPEDKQNFTALVQEFRTQLDALSRQTGDTYELSAFLPADPAKIDAGIEVAEVMADFDFVTVQGYDLYGAWGNTTNHQAQIYSPPDDPSPTGWSGDQAIGTYLAQGAPADKLVLGVPAYGRGWAGVPSTNNGLYQTATGPAPGTWENGIEDYDVLKNRPGTRYTDAEAMAVWLYVNGQFWSYDDEATILQKMDYVKANGLGGAMIWSLDGDDGTLTGAMATGLA